MLAKLFTEYTLEIVSTSHFTEKSFGSFFKVGKYGRRGRFCTLGKIGGTLVVGTEVFALLATMGWVVDGILVWKGAAYKLKALKFRAEV